MVAPHSKALQLADRRLVQSLTPAELLHSANISSVKQLKIDAEGFDGRIVRAFANHMGSLPQIP